MGMATFSIPAPASGTLTVTKVTNDDGCSSAVDLSEVLTLQAPPVFTACPAMLLTANTAPGLCSAVVTYTVTATGDPVPTLSYAFTGATMGAGGGTGTGSTFNKGSTTVTVTATNACGAPTCVFTVTVTDIEDPSIVCPASISRNTDLGQCSAVVTYASPSFSDNCPGGGVVIVPPSLPSGAAFPKGVSSVVWEATDAAGLTKRCTFTVNVNDTQAPNITCPANIIRSNDAGQCGAVVTYAQPTATDNCGTASVTLQSAPNTASGSNFPIGTTTMVVWRAFDTAIPLANTATCFFTITVIDTQAPNIACPSNMSVGNTPGLCTALANFVTPSGSDNCPLPPNAVMQTSGPTSGMPFQKGQTTVVFRVTDAAGLTKTCSFRVTVNDTQAPTISCPGSQSVGTAATSCSSTAVTYATPTATDNCAPVPTVVRIGGPASGSTFPVGTTTVIWRAIDGAGRSSTCSFAVTVTDNTPPTISCPPNIVQNNPPNACNTPVTYTTPTATDNCGVNSVYLLSGLASGSVFPSGTTAVTWRAADNNGASSACTFTVTVTCGVAKPGDGNTQASPGTRPSQTSKIWKDAEPEAVLNLSLAPNPAATQVRFKVSGLGEKSGELLVFDGLGRMVLRQELAPEQNDGTFEVSDLPEGLYRVSVRTEKRVITKNLVVVKD